MTTDPSPPQRPAREHGAVRQLARLFLVQLLAVIAVAAVIAVVFTAAGRGTGRLRADTGPPGAHTTSSSTATAGGSDSTAPDGAAATTAAPSLSAAPPAASPAPPTPPSPTPSAVDARPRVDVLNQSSPGGTAADTADTVTSLGWKVGRVDNFVGNVRATSVYYPPGLETQAKELAKALPGPQRVLPGFSTLSGTRLSLILVR